MNIWYFSHYAGGPGIGKPLRAYHLGRAWRALGHRCTVFVAQYHHLLESEEALPPEKTVDGVRYIALKARRYAGNGVSRLLNMADFCRSMLRLPSRVPGDIEPPDVIIVTSPHPFAIYPAYRLARRYKAKLVFEVRDIWPLSITEINGTSRLHPIVILSGLAERFAYRKADLAASLLGGAESHMRQHGLAAGKFVHVPNGVDTSDPVEPLAPTSEAGVNAARQIEAWKKDGRAIIIHPGSQGIPNALDRLLDAVAIVNARGMAARFGVVLLGGGGMNASLRAHAERQNLDNVAFFPNVSKAEALWLTAHSDIGYAGARNHEKVYRYGISFNKIMDFMEAGLPVILPLSAHGDPVSASGCGIVTGSDTPEAIAAAIATMLNAGPEQRAAMGARGKEAVRRDFDYARIAANYIAAIERN